MALAFAQHSPQHQGALHGHSPQYHGNQLQQGVTAGASLQDWLKAWRSWAATRKRGKMAQFIVQKLEDSKQARWLDITIGKFELTEWHSIAEEWFKEKPRSSDQVDAPCMLRKGLPRAFPGLEEVKTESIKEGTQYRSRVFQATTALVQEVQLYVNKSGVGGAYPAVQQSYFRPSPAKNGNMYGDQNGFPMTSQHQTQQQFASSTSFTAHGRTPNPLQAPIKIADTNDVLGQNFTSSPGSIQHSPGRVKMEANSPYSIHTTSPYNSVYNSELDVDSPAPSDSASNSASPYAYTSLNDGSTVTGSMYSGQDPNLSPDVSSQIMSEGQGFMNGYNQMNADGTYYGPMLQVPTSGEGMMSNDWGASSSSPHFSPDPTFPQDSTAASLDMPSSVPTHPVSPPIMAAGPMQPQMQQPQSLLEVKAYPEKSPLEGGGQLCLVFGGHLPRGPKWLSFVSQQRPEYVHQVEALENNEMALSTAIPKHDIPETLTLQVICSGQLVAQTEFTYYANAQYNSDLLFQYLVHNFPSYFPEAGMDGSLGGQGGGLGGGGGGGGGGGYVGGGYNYGNIPPTSYNLLLGSCRLGIEELVKATLQLPAMAAITTEQLQKAHQLCEEHNHNKLAEVLQVLVELSEVTSRGQGDEEDEDEEEPVLTSQEGRLALAKLDSGSTVAEGGMKIISRLRQILKMDQRSKLEEEREQQVPSSPTVQPPSPVPQEACEDASTILEAAVGAGGEGAEPPQRRLSSSNRLTRQDQSIREDDDLTPPAEPPHSRKSIAEKDDQLPPLRPLMPSNRRTGVRRPFISYHSDAADSAVSMSFDRDGDFEQEVLRRNSASLAQSGLYSSSLNGSAINISIDQEAGVTFANSLQYECVYQVTDDYPPQSDSTNIIFKAGDRIIQIGDTYVRDKGPDEFAELLQQEATKGTSIHILPRVSPPPSASINSSLGYCSLDAPSGRSIGKKPLLHDSVVGIDSITTRVSNLLTAKGSGYKRSVTLPYLDPDHGFGFKLMGGSAVGLFISEVSLGKKELLVGDQVLEIAGQSALQMSYYEALDLVEKAKEKLQLTVVQNKAKYQSCRDQFEYESFYLRSTVDHTPSDMRDMTLNKGSLLRVVNSALFPDAWLAWSVDESTGIDRELRRIPTPKKAFKQFGKQAYQPVEDPFSSQSGEGQNVMVS